ncbi:hypothetical protein MP477_04675 [Chryseobacterium sp. WG23]|uniref:hypothetical protein n=1 Tax=Chryseobacterium sp. WG23 TaxID=2926910 RepID=UPI00211F1005|nr:hypothetical protein [Chryseobacterium sp. WG23]MCQ9634246.1 hypothetical protein [Chryseobacterium sp. WG23]
MENSLKTLFLAMVLILLHSCGSVTTYDAPLEPGQTVYQRQDPKFRQTETRSENNSIPEPGQIEMKSNNENNNDNIPEPGQTEMKSNDENNNDNVPEPGQTEMKDAEEQ